MWEHLGRVREPAAQQLKPPLERSQPLIRQRAREEHIAAKKPGSISFKCDFSSRRFKVLRVSKQRKILLLDERGAQM